MELFQNGQQGNRIRRAIHIRAHNLVTKSVLLSIRHICAVQHSFCIRIVLHLAKIIKRPDQLNLRFRVPSIVVTIFTFHGSKLFSRILPNQRSSQSSDPQKHYCHHQYESERQLFLHNNSSCSRFLVCHIQHTLRHPRIILNAGQRVSDYTLNDLLIFEVFHI